MNLEILLAHVDQDNSVLYLGSIFVYTKKLGELVHFNYKFSADYSIVLCRLNKKILWPFMNINKCTIFLITNVLCRHVCKWKRANDTGDIQCTWPQSYLLIILIHYFSFSCFYLKMWQRLRMKEELIEMARVRAI